MLINILVDNKRVKQFFLKMTVENLGNHDSNSETTTAANKQRFHEQKDTLCTCFFTLVYLFGQWSSI